MDSLLVRLRKTLASELKIKEEKIRLDTSFKEDLNTDSLDAIFIVMALEKEFGIEIPDEDAEKFLSISDVIDYLLHRMSGEMDF